MALIFYFCSSMINSWIIIINVDLLSFTKIADLEVDDTSNSQPTDINTSMYSNPAYAIKNQSVPQNDYEESGGIYVTVSEDDYENSTGVPVYLTVSWSFHIYNTTAT